MEIYIELLKSDRNFPGNIERVVRRGNTYEVSVIEDFDPRNRNHLRDLVSELKRQGVQIEWSNETERELMRLTVGQRNQVRI